MTLGPDPLRWPEDARSYWIEKAGDLEHDAGGLPRHEADRRAEAIVRAWWAKRHEFIRRPRAAG